MGKMADAKSFLKELAPQAIRAREDGSPLFTSVRLAQNLLETGGVIHPWFNLGGIKAGNGKPTAWWDGTLTVKGTWEEVKGKEIRITAGFRVYKSVYHFYRDQDLLFQLSRYKRVRDAKTPEEQAHMLYACGYATDSAYATKIISLINKHGLLQYDKGVTSMKFVPSIVKERIAMVGGKLTFIPIGTDAQRKAAYAKPGTDVRLVRLPVGKVRYEFKYEKGAKVSSLVKKHKADLGFNFPYFYNGIPLGDTEDNDVLISAAYGKMLSWHEFAVVDGRPIIGQLDRRDKQDLLLQGSPLLVENGKGVAHKYAELEQTAEDIVGKKSTGFTKRAQRTFIGIDKEGALLVAIADGRTGSDQGLDIKEMEAYMLAKGAVWALNGDGGGSTILADQTGGLNQKLNTGINERAVSHAVLVYGLEPAAGGSKPVTGGTNLSAAFANELIDRYIKPARAQALAKSDQKAADQAAIDADLLRVASGQAKQNS